MENQTKPNLPDDSSREQLTVNLVDRYRQLEQAMRNFLAYAANGTEPPDEAALYVALCEMELEELGIDLDEIGGSLHDLGLNPDTDPRLQPLLNYRTLLQSSS